MTTSSQCTGDLIFWADTESVATAVGSGTVSDVGDSEERAQMGAAAGGFAN